MFKLRKYFFRLVDVNIYLALYRKLIIRNLCQVGRKVIITHHAELLHHGECREQIKINDFSILDGVLEVYSAGKLSIGRYTFIGRCRIYCSNEVNIGNHCLISDNVCIMDSNLHPISASKRVRISKLWVKGIFPDVYSNVPNKPVILEDHCWIGNGSLILKGVQIGEGSIVGASSVVTKDVPAWTIVAGNPAKIIREIPLNER